MPTFYLSPPAPVGHNNPPPATPFDLSREEIDGLFGEAKNWLNGTPIETQAQADAVGKLITDLRAAAGRAEERRKAEAKPFDDGKAEVQARYNPLIQKERGKADLAIASCKQALVPFLAAQEAARKAEALRARQEAEAKQVAAQKALKASQGDLAAREQAEVLARDAKAADKAASRIEADRAGAHGGDRAVTLRARLRPVLDDRREAARFFWTECPDQFDALLTKLAEDYVRAGRRTIPGFTLTEVMTAQ